MPTYSQGPRLLKGAIVAIDPAGGGRRTIVFQYNPETLKRSLEPQLAGAPCTSDEWARAGRLAPGRRADR
jgi:hypothetical protein